MSDSKAMILGLKGHVLTTEEKAFFRGEQPWGFILFARNLSEPAQIADLVASLRETVGGRDAPVLIDQEGGRVQRLRPPIVPNYPPAAVLGALYDADRDRGKRAAWLLSRLHAFDLQRSGINVDCLPVLDVPVAGSHNVIGDRAYGTEPETVSVMGLEAAAGLKAGGVLPVIKHMPGHGRGMADSHHELPVVTASRAELEAHDFIPFRAARHELMAMSAHVVYTALDPDHPATTSRYVIDKIIRGHIGFDGLLMSDDISMNALKGTIAERARAIAANGCDMVLHCHGDMDEMKDVAAAVPVLSGKALRRAKAVEAALGRKDDADEQAIRAEFDRMLATS
ncbi:beta-N-acetylhexosaminidase [Rhizobiaceae bacterium BDR2-2]|uniref:beta-N-acetylhexosaminidase n=1 Tax=Ectorhizobium quercum TaxID=2965071 RepID=A0AAE3MYJ8_9HYPH|nr:beta-N-acetylhexosaminidase [Ectorhizobium quercum]MCX8997563.1 beta-N-acetylhexosaminidase [Ectorhizobium quercum]